MTRFIALSGSDVDADICERVEQLGYTPSKTIRLYGQDYEVISDPFIESDIVVIQVRTKKEIRTLRLPSTILQKVLKRAS